MQPALPSSSPFNNFASEPGKIKKFGNSSVSYKLYPESLHPIIFFGKLFTKLWTDSALNLYPLSYSKLYRMILTFGIWAIIEE